MSTHEMQWRAEVDAKLSQLTSQAAALDHKIKSQPSAADLVDAIGARIAREGQILREDFVGKFAGHITPFIDSVTTRVKNLEERLSDAEDEEQSLEEKLVAHEAKITQQLADAEKRQLDVLNWFVDALNQHHKINSGTLSKQRAAAKDCRHAASETAQAADLCTTFAQNYESTALYATHALQSLTANMNNELRSLVQNVERKASATIMPVMQRAREMTEREFMRRAWWMIVGAMIILLISGVLTWYAQPSHYVMRDAAKWRTFESDLTPDQADRINKVLNEIQAEQRAEEEKNNKR